MVVGMHQDVITRPIRARVAFALALVLATASAAAQEAAPPDPAPPQAQTGPSIPTPPEVIGAIGRFIDQSISTVGAGVGAGVKGAGETLGGATSAAGDLAKGVTDAAGVVARLPLANVASGWERCALAPNGAPDCVAASVTLCKSKGFERGNSLDITSARKCPASAWLQGRTPSDAECVNESFVSRAICQ
jgi:hypothetical protein